MQGKAVYPAINIMHSCFWNAGLPSAAEGFCSVLVGDVAR